MYTLILLQKAYPDNQSLFKGTKDENLSDASPYIFKVDKDLFEKIKDPFASLEAITVVESEVKMASLSDHFKQFIYHKIKGQENYFRFWDARVLSRFLPAVSADKLDSFFEGINWFYILNREKAIANGFFLKRGKLQTNACALSDLFVMDNNEQLELQHENAAAADSTQTKKTKRKFFK